jgi:proteasome lid subunit RPN8/RPN11
MHPEHRAASSEASTERRRRHAGWAPPWRITDTALERLGQDLLAHAPERGAALLGPAGHRLVTHVLTDPETGSAASYRHSAALQHLLTQTLERGPDLAYRGTVHTHPGAMAEPSDQDGNAFRAVLLANPDLGPDVLFPILVCRPLEALGTIVESWGGDHLLPLPGGTLGGYTCRSRDGVPEVTAVVVSVLAVHSFVTMVCADTDWTPHESGVVREPTTGAVWLRYVLSTRSGGGSPTGLNGAETSPEVLVSPCFPWAAPMFSTSSGAFWSPVWDLSLPHEDRVAAAASTLREQFPGR